MAVRLHPEDSLSSWQPHARQAWRSDSMLTIKKILLAVDFPHTYLPVIHQAATLARHFHSEIVFLHVTTDASREAVLQDGSKLAPSNMLTEIIQSAEKNGDRSLGSQLDGLTIHTILLEGDPTQAIVQTAQQQKIDLIMMPSQGDTFCHFLMGSSTSHAFHGAECPVWTGAYTQESPTHEFAIRNILCAVNFDPHTHKTVSLAAQMATEFGARLTLAHVTAGVVLWGPGGDYVDAEWRDRLVRPAAEHLATIQRELGTKAEVFIGSGDLAEVLSRAAKLTKADLLVIGCRPYGGHLRNHGYGIICAVPIPILNV